MPPKKSIFRQPGAQHFQLVHRSQRDPLYHDPEASRHVLKAFERENDKKGKSRADLEGVLDPNDLAHDLGRANIGEASLYGVYYDDTDYDYMQHLKQVGGQEEGVDSILLEAPSRPKDRSKGKAPIALRDIPTEALPSTSELPRTYESQENIPSSIAGFQPDIDPHLRQTLEALEDDAFVDESLDEDFFGELVASGEREYPEEVEFEFHEDGFPNNAGLNTREENPLLESDSWEERFAHFKKVQKATAADDDLRSDTYSEGGDTIGTLPQLSVLGGKRRRKGTSDASGYSMSSSSMFRNEGLTTLDERFDQIEKEYAEEEEQEDETTDDDQAPELITSREDFDTMMDEFLDNYEIIGRKLKPVLAGETATDKLNTIRRALADSGPVDLDASLDYHEPDILMPIDVDDVQNHWDCETILTTYSNLENHPRLIRAKAGNSVPKIKLDPRTGLPSIQEEKSGNRKSRITNTSSTTEESDEDDERPARVTISRSRNESKEDKKARKQAAKAEKQTRRVEKKTNKEAFSTEFKRQQKALVGKESARIRKL